MSTNIPRKSITFGAFVQLEVGGNEQPKVIVSVNGELHQVSLLDADRIQMQIKNAVKHYSESYA